MCYWLLTENGKIIVRTTIQHLMIDEERTSRVKEEIQTFDNHIYDVLHHKDDTEWS